jgi:hypothetical protein
MTALAWDQTGERLFETGVDRGVLYIPDESGDYVEGFAWNGLTTVTESPSGAEANPQYADNIKYLTLMSTEEFGATIEAFTYPDEFGQCDGTAEPSPGVKLGQQIRRQFGLAYRTKVGNDLEGADHGYKLHLVYGALAAPSEKAYSTINDSPEAISFSWELTTYPIQAEGFKPTSQIVIDSTQVDSDDLGTLEDILYGGPGDDARLPLPDEIVAIFGGGVTDVNLRTAANNPTFNESSGVLTLPAVTGVQWQVDGVDQAPGAQTAIASGDSITVTAEPQSGYNLVGDDEWTFQRT